MRSDEGLKEEIDLMRTITWHLSLARAHAGAEEGRGLGRVVQLVAERKVRKE